MRPPRSKAANVCRTVLFSLPLAIVFGIPGAILWLGGEFMNPERLVRLQSDDSRQVLHGAAYTNTAIYVKSRLLLKRRPQLLVLGNSRVLQFRREFFLPEVSFYNAGSAVVRIRNFRAFLQCLPKDALPRTLLIATDAGYFCRGFDLVEKDSYNDAWLQAQMQTYSTPGTVFQTRWRDVWRDLTAGKIKCGRLFSLDGWNTRVGLNALSYDAGFRNDGSYRYSLHESDASNPLHHDYQFAKTLHAVETGGGRFAWGDKPSDEALAEVDALLDFCASNQIHLVAFMPPHAHAVWVAMQALGDRYAYIQGAETEMRKRLNARGFEFYNFSDCADLGAPDSEALDGHHGSERTYLRILISMLEQGSHLNACADLDGLRQTLAASPGQLTVFQER